MMNEIAGRRSAVHCKRARFESEQRPDWQRLDTAQAKVRRQHHRACSVTLLLGTFHGCDGGYDDCHSPHSGRHFDLAEPHRMRCRARCVVSAQAAVERPGKNNCKRKWRRLLRVDGRSMYYDGMLPRRRHYSVERTGQGETIPRAAKAARRLRRHRQAQRRNCQVHCCQYLYFCTSKASIKDFLSSSVRDLHSRILQFRLTGILLQVPIGRCDGR